VLGEIRATSTDRETPLRTSGFTARLSARSDHTSVARRGFPRPREGRTPGVREVLRPPQGARLPRACGPVSASSKHPKVALPWHGVPPKPCQREENKMCPSTSSREKGTTDSPPTDIPLALPDIGPKFLGTGESGTARRTRRRRRFLRLRRHLHRPVLPQLPFRREVHFHTSSTPVSCRIGIWEGTRERWNGWRSDTT